MDQGFWTAVVEHGRQVGIDVEIVQRNRRQTGFVPQPIRWRAEQRYYLAEAWRPLVLT
ncbi:hypothetical protein [Streptomyces mirabilis]|uniref:hypothetical protein n=1 Tax=Streptomyces mirabilis TaxID=68239 RepID=UPI0036DBAB3E